jgi:hypothetical protein
VFEVERASSDPDALTVSEQVAVDATVRDLGGTTGNYTAGLRANRAVVATRDVTHAPNATRRVLVSFTPAALANTATPLVTFVLVSSQSSQHPSRLRRTDADGARHPTANRRADARTDSGGGESQPSHRSTTGAGGPEFGVTTEFGALLAMAVILLRWSRT